MSDNDYFGMLKEKYNLTDEQVSLYIHATETIRDLQNLEMMGLTNEMRHAKTDLELVLKQLMNNDKTCNLRRLLIPETEVKEE